MPDRAPNFNLVFQLFVYHSFIYFMMIEWMSDRVSDYHNLFHIFIYSYIYLFTFVMMKMGKEQ